MVKQLVIAIAMLFSVGASAEIYSDPTRIVTLYPTSTGYMFVTGYRNTTYSTCDSGGRWSISKSYANYDAMIASLLLAFASDKQIRLVIDELPANCDGSVNRFYVYQ